jgi:hypothetical protein
MYNSNNQAQNQPRPAVNPNVQQNRPQNQYSQNTNNQSRPNAGQTVQQNRPQNPNQQSYNNQYSQNANQQRPVNNMNNMNSMAGQQPNYSQPQPNYNQPQPNGQYGYSAPNADYNLNAGYAPKSGGSKKTIIIIVVIVAILLCCVIGGIVGVKTGAVKVSGSITTNKNKNDEETEVAVEESTASSLDWLTENNVTEEKESTPTSTPESQATVESQASLPNSSGSTSTPESSTSSIGTTETPSSSSSSVSNNELKEMFEDAETLLKYSDDVEYITGKVGRGSVGYVTVYGNWIDIEDYDNPEVLVNIDKQMILAFGQQYASYSTLKEITQSQFESAFSEVIDSEIDSLESQYSENSTTRVTYKDVTVYNGNDLMYAKYIEYNDGMCLEYVFGADPDTGYIYYIAGVGTSGESTMTSTMSSIASSYKVNGD